MSTVVKEKNMTMQLSEKIVYHIPLKEIYCDDNFNCRGAVTLESVRSLAESIEARGLDSPITVMHYNQDGYKYRIVSGHRRYTAHKFLKRDTIEAFVKEGEYSELDAYIANLEENIERRDLNIVQEAEGLRNIAKTGMSTKDMATKLRKSVRWVDLRIGLLALPKDIQGYAELGLIKTEEIENLINLRRSGAGQDKLYTYANACRDRRTAQSKTTLKVLNEIKRLGNKDLVKLRPKEEVEHIHNLIMDALKQPTLATWSLAWVLGTVTTKDLLEQVEFEAKLYGILWTMPQNYIVDDAGERERLGL